MAGQRLTAAKVRTAEPGRYCDGDGLYLLVKANRGRYWVFRYRLHGAKMREAGLGRAGEERNSVKLADARDKASELRRQVKAGMDPLAARAAALAASKAAAQEAVRQGITFREAARRCIESQTPGWSSGKHRAQWPATIETYVNPVFGDIPVSAVTTEHVLAVLQPIWSEITETAKRVRGRIEKILDFAKARGWRSGENPARWKGHLAETLPSPSKVAPVEHHAALPWGDIAGFMAVLREQRGNGAKALEFAILTASRSKEVREASWREIDLANAVWTIPAGRMKARKEHRVPLSGAAMDVLRHMAEARKSDAPEELVFPGSALKRPLSDMTLTAVLRRMNLGHLTAHGFRSSFRDWAAETTRHPNEVVEAALAHSIGNKVEAAYRRGDLFEKRKQLMADWAVFCSTPAGSRAANVIPMREAS